jgi:hypothetical protein
MPFLGLGSRRAVRWSLVKHKAACDDQATSHTKMPYWIEYASWLVLQLVDDYYVLYLAAFLMTLALQTARKNISPSRYRMIWGLLTMLGLLWGGAALWQYLPKFFRWYLAYFLLPGVLAAAGLAKLQQYLSSRVCLSLLTLIPLVFVAANVIMRPYNTGPYSMHKENPWNRCLECDIHRWASGYGWHRDVGSSGGTSGLMLGLIPGNSPSFRWVFYRSWGIALLASVLAVPAKFRIPHDEKKEGQTDGLAHIPR